MTDAAAAQVLELERRRWEALVASDTGTLHELFAEGMAYTHSNALVDTKSSYIKSIEDGAVSYVGVDSSDEEIRVFGGTAVVTGRAVIDARAGGGCTARWRGTARCGPRPAAVGSLCAGSPHRSPSSEVRRAAARAEPPRTGRGGHPAASGAGRHQAVEPLA